MGRNRSQPKGPKSIGDHHVIDAIRKIDTACQRTVAVMTEYAISRNETIRALFDPDVLRRAAGAAGLIDPSSHRGVYPINAGTSLTVHYDHAPWPTICAEAMVLQPSAAPLLQFAKEVRAIYEQFAEIKATLVWLNRNATLGAIRYYWPLARSLCPGDRELQMMTDVPSRYNRPRQIGDWIQLFKDTTACWAGAEMLPADASPRPRGTMWLTMAAGTITRGEVSLCTDHMVFNI